MTIKLNEIGFPAPVLEPGASREDFLEVLEGVFGEDTELMADARAGDFANVSERLRPWANGFGSEGRVSGCRYAAASITPTRILEIMANPIGQEATALTRDALRYLMAERLRFWIERHGLHHRLGAVALRGDAASA